ncbi:hypothetical protein NA57DRAFT_62425 [Rhizodiscina lignyota]|uniref:Uncharacterized protein n=1 Tax=Rhizodiscina lignyota TaxID=1504668 RepID=A0A9P4M470_9PEZI|nr:hypothetical protein NA57DRAFT_62425 [Rhizodiscina lignyota]
MPPHGKNKDDVTSGLSTPSPVSHAVSIHLAFSIPSPSSFTSASGSQAKGLRITSTTSAQQRYNSSGFGTTTLRTRSTITEMWIKVIEEMKCGTDTDSMFTTSATIGFPKNTSQLWAVESLGNDPPKTSITTLYKGPRTVSCGSLTYAVPQPASTTGISEVVTTTYRPRLTNPVFAQCPIPAPTCSIQPVDCVNLLKSAQQQWSGQPESFTVHLPMCATAPPSCDRCTIAADSVKVYFFAVPSTVSRNMCASQPVASGLIYNHPQPLNGTKFGITTLGKYTLRADRAYVWFNRISATYPSVCFTDMPSAVASALSNFPVTTYSGTMITIESASLRSLRYRQYHQFPYNFADFIPGQEVPWSARNGESSCWEGSCSVLWSENYAPTLAVPDAVRSLHPAWRNCDLALDGIYDPPYALTTVTTGLMTPSPPSTSHSSTKASPALTPHPSIATRTRSPKIHLSMDAPSQPSSKHSGRLKTVSRSDSEDSYAKRLSSEFPQAPADAKSSTWDTSTSIGDAEGGTHSHSHHHRESTSLSHLPAKDDPEATNSVGAAPPANTLDPGSRKSQSRSGHGTQHMSRTHQSTQLAAYIALGLGGLLDDSSKYVTHSKTQMSKDLLKADNTLSQSNVPPNTEVRSSAPGVSMSRSRDGYSVLLPKGSSALLARTSSHTPGIYYSTHTPNTHTETIWILGSSILTSTGPLTFSSHTLGIDGAQPIASSTTIQSSVTLHLSSSRSIQTPVPTSAPTVGGSSTITSSISSMTTSLSSAQSRGAPTYLMKTLFICFILVLL